MTLGQKIRKVRMLNGWTQEELAEIIRVYQYQVSNWESDKAKPSLDMLTALSEALGVTADELIKEELDV